MEVVGGPGARSLAPGSVHRAVLLGPDDTERLLGADAHHGGTLVLLGDGDVPLLALLLLDWSPPAPVDATTLRELTGAEAVCRALDLPLEPAEPQHWNAAALRAVLHRPGPAPRWPGRAGLPMAWGAVLLATLTLVGAGTAPGSGLEDVIGGASGGLLGLTSAVLALLVGVPTALGLLAAARARRAAPGALDGPEVVVDARPAGPVPAAVLEHQLRATPQTLLLRRFGTVVLLPGPGEGGVQQAVLEPAAVRLRDLHGRLYSSLATDVWCGTPAARDALRDKLTVAGLQVLQAPVDAPDPLDLDELSPEGRYARLRSRPADRGEVFAGPLRLVALATGSAAAATYAAVESGAAWQVAPAAGLGLLCVSVTVAVLAVEWRSSRRRRRAAVVVDPRASVAASP